MTDKWLMEIGKAASALRFSAEYDDLLSDQAKGELRAIAITLSEIPVAHENADSLQSRYEKAMRYSIDLQRAIEWHCRGQRVPDRVEEGCPHHARMLDQRLAALGAGVDTRND